MFSARNHVFIREEPIQYSYLLVFTCSLAYDEPNSVVKSHPETDLCSMLEHAAVVSSKLWGNFMFEQLVFEAISCIPLADEKIAPVRG